MRSGLVILFLVVFGNCFAQSTNIGTFFHNNVKKADFYFEHFAYRNALELYLHKFEKDSGTFHVRERIAMCYFKLHDPINAEIWYSTLAAEPEIHPAAKFEYAEALSMNGKYEQSREWFRKYLEDQPDDPIAKDKLAFLDALYKYENTDFRFTIGVTDFNSDHAEYGAHYFHDGVVFASSRDVDLLIKHRPSDGLSPDESLLNLFYAERTPGGRWNKSVAFHHNKMRTAYHEGPMAFYDNYRKGAFTQSNVENGKRVSDDYGKVNLRIYFAEIAHLGDFEHVAPFEYNNDEYSNAHPSFNEDGTIMYFSSTKPGGLGESDLYYTEFKNGKWRTPINLGAAVNTREDESYPYLANDSTLFFSSNGHGTFGGLDIYVAYKRNGEFGKPINLGPPINTRFDDFSLVIDSVGRSGFLASNREGGKGQDDIYTWYAQFYLVAGEVRELSGRNIKLPEASIVAYNTQGELIDSTRSDANGDFILNLPFDQDYTISATKDGFEPLEEVQFTTRGKPFGVDSVTLLLWKQNLFAKGRLYSNETQAILPHVTVTVNNLTDGKSETVVIDDSVGYSFLIKPNKKYRIEAKKDGFIPNGFDLDTHGMTEGNLLNDIVLEEVYIEKEIALFAYDEHRITPEAAAKLDRVIRTLRRFPKATVNISAHADARGTKEYNARLSRSRAMSTQEYLLSKGIAKKRIQSSWFGEELVLNQCSDGVECHEELHSQNRRAEVKVQREPVD